MDLTQYIQKVEFRVHAASDGTLYTDKVERKITVGLLIRIKELEIVH